MASDDETAQLHVAVIGAGISGLCFARTYLSVHPDAKLILFEKENVVGGVWSRERVYDTFWTQGAVNYFEFSDCPMPALPKQDMLHGFFKAGHSTSYLESYATQHDFNGSSLLDRILFNAILNRAERDGDGWRLQVHDRLQGSNRQFRAEKLVIASGTTSIPVVPRLPGVESCGIQILHNFDFGSSTLLQNKSAQKVAVLGAGKSSADMVYALVKAGKEVSWIVRPTGTGPLTMVPPDGVGPYRGAFDLGSTRIASTLQPSLLIPRNLWTWFLHESWLGRGLLAKVWAGVEAKIRGIANYHGRQSTRGFEKLEPHTSMFWQNNPGGLLNHPDFFDLVAEHVDVHYDEVELLDKRCVKLKSGSSIEVDTLLLGTGWDHSLSFLSADLRATLGLPYHKTSVEAEKDEWALLEEEADVEVIKRFPDLAQPPPHVRPQTRDEPFRLYNLVAPVGDASRSIACIGQVSTSNYYSTAEVQSLWATAYFDATLQLPSLQAQKAEVARFVAWNRRRYLTTGDQAFNVSLETVAYNDQILAQLGLNSHLKGRRWWSFWFTPCRAADLADLIDEYKSQHAN